MQGTMWKLQNEIKNYEWGSKTAITELFGIANPTLEPQAEIWMGAHPNGCSIVINSQGQQVRLDDLIKSAPEQILGKNISDRFAGLPYLFKVLSAAKPLSIQVHPEKSKAQIGFEKENEMGIPLNAANRNYKDPNHKPELVYALTRYRAMNGFRPINEIIEQFSKINVPTLGNYIEQLTKSPTPEQLKSFFETLLTLSERDKKEAINELSESLQNKTDDLSHLVKQLIENNPNDIGVFTPFILNVITLAPGEAMYLDAETPHAYMQGTGMEIMASSDNVLRAGLTPKYIDVKELIENTQFKSMPLNTLLTAPIVNENKIDFPIPVEDFKFQIINSDTQKRSEAVASAEILFCISGKVTITTKTESIELDPGESVFISYAAKEFQYSGQGQLARAFN